VSVVPPLRIAVVGCGRVFERFYRPALAATQELEVVGLCEADPGRRERAAAALPGAVAAASLEALALARPPDAVLVLTPPATHRPLTERALLGGMHVLVEKPMALDLAGARAMLTAATLAGRRLQVGFNRRFRPPYRRLREQVAVAGGVRGLRCDLAVPSAAWGGKAGFLGVDALGGGVLDDVLSHQVDLVRWITESEPRRVRAEPRPAGGVRCDLELDSGATASCRAEHAPYAEYLEVMLRDGPVVAASGARTYRRRRAAGPLARLYARLSDRAALAATRALGRRGLTLESFDEQLRDFACAVRGGGAGGAGAADGVAAVAVVEAARASLRAGGWHDVG
jgi:predicted dehydrogenase